MAAVMKPWRSYLSWLLPHGVYVWYGRARTSGGVTTRTVSNKILSSNADIRDICQGQRCFILGNAYSVKQLDLRCLAGEKVFSVSNAYLHDGYADIAPAYHCLPQVTYGLMTESDVVAWFQEMDRHIGGAELFLNESEADLVARHRLFADRQVHYLALRKSFDELRSRDMIDISLPVPRVESVPVMVIMIAMYMGFREIVLLGVDHDHFKTGVYRYAFETKTQKGKDYTVNTENEVTLSRHDDFQSLARLWRQYRVLREIAGSNGIRVLNASPESELDEFPRVRIEELLEVQ